MKIFLLICLLAIQSFHLSSATISLDYSNEHLVVNSQENQIAPLNSDVSGENRPAGNNTHNNCCPGCCHLFDTAIFQTHSLGLAENRSLAVSSIDAYQSYISSRIERPNWVLAI